MMISHFHRAIAASQGRRGWSEPINYFTSNGSSQSLYYWHDAANWLYGVPNDPAMPVEIDDRNGPNISVQIDPGETYEIDSLVTNGHRRLPPTQFPLDPAAVSGIDLILQGTLTAGKRG